MDNDFMAKLKSYDLLAYEKLKNQNIINRNEVKNQIQAIINRFITTALVMDYSLPQETRNNMGYYILDIFTEIIEEMDKRNLAQNNLTTLKESTND